MNSTRVAIGILAVGLGVTTGCLPAHKKNFMAVEKEIQTRMAPPVPPLKMQWVQNPSEEKDVRKKVNSLLSGELTVREAVEVALLNNQALQATFDNLGIAQADLVQAGLLQNPEFGAHIGFPDKSELRTSTEFSVSQNFLDFLVLPLRKKVASAQLEQVKLQVGDAILRLIAEVKGAYFTLQGALQMHDLRQTVLKAAEIAAEFSKRQFEAGNINELEWATQQSFVDQAKLDLYRSEKEILMAREHLIRLMGLAFSDSTWRVPPNLFALPAREPSLDNLGALTLSQRLDLAAARHELEILKKEISLTRVQIVPQVHVGASLEREQEKDEGTLAGPTFDFEVPIFDRRQAAIARLQSQLRQSRQKLAALETEALSEVRTLLGELRIHRQMAEYYRDTAIPLRARIINLAQKHYNYMLIGVFQMLEAKQDEVEAEREYIEALRDYWITRAELERAAGGTLFAEEPVPLPSLKPAQPVPEKQERHEHHEHGGKTLK